MDNNFRVLPRDVIPQPIPNNTRIPLSDDEKKRLKDECVKNAIKRSSVSGSFLLYGGWILITIILRSFVSDINLTMLNGIGVYIGTYVAFWVVIIGGMNIYSQIQGKQEASRVIDNLERAKAYEQQERVQKENDEAVAIVNNEADSSTNRLMYLYTTSKKDAAELPVLINNASGWLLRAQAEYNANAFAPFWDAVENAAIYLATFNDKAKILSANATDYYKLLQGKKHTFPVFPVNMRTIPDDVPVVNDLYRIVRLGQTNFQFANIWEHRRTRAVLISGFQTLGEAVNNLRGAITYSISNLRQSITTDVAKLVEEEIMTRDALDKRLVEQNQMLNNIQNTVNRES